MKAILFQLSVILLLLSACTAPTIIDTTPQPTPQANATSTVVEQATAVPSPTATNTPSPTETAVPIPTPAVDLHNNKTILYYDAADGHYYRIGLDGGPPDQLTQQPDSGHVMPDMVEQSLLDFNTPSISPNGRFLLQYDVYKSWQLLNVPDQTLLAEGVDDFFYSPTWSPDSQQFAYIKDESQLCLFHLATASENCLWQSDSRLFGAEWSPDGRYIAVAQDDAADDMGRGEIWLIDPETGEALRAEAYQGSPEIALGSIFTWLSDGDALLIYNLPEGGSARTVLEDAQTIRFPNRVWSASPDGRFFYTHDGQLVDATGTLLHQIADPSACPDGIRIRQNAWSSDSSRLAFVSACNVAEPYEGDWTLTIVDVASGEIVWEQVLPENYSLLSWSTDKNALLLSHKTSGWPRDSDIYMLRLDSNSKPQLIVSGAIFLGVYPPWLSEK